jgi:AcrR family transcriptional regulator
MNLSKREREQQENENLIIETAIELFCKNGYETITMNLIAEKSEFTKRTVYRYFNSKEDLFFATAYKGHQYLYEMLFEAIQQGSTGYEKVCLSYNAYYKFITKHPDLAKLINQRRYFKSENLEESSPNYRKFMEIDQLIFESLRRIFVQGQEEGSIRSDLAVDQFALSTIYIAVGFFQLVSFTGDTYPKHFGYEKDSFIQFSIERLLESIKAEDK